MAPPRGKSASAQAVTMACSLRLSTAPARAAGGYPKKMERLTCGGHELELAEDHELVRAPRVKALIAEGDRWRPPPHVLGALPP
jgi:hypothetical protein